MPNFIIKKPHGLMKQAIFEALFLGRAAKKLSNSHKLVHSGDVPDLDKRCTSTGIEIYPVIFEGSVDDAVAVHNPSRVYLPRGSMIPGSAREARKKDPFKILFYYDSVAYVTGASANEGRISYLNQFRVKYFGNVFLMSSLFFLHEDYFQRKPETVVDPFLGRGGSIIAAMKLGIERIIGFEVDLRTMCGMLRNWVDYLEQTRSDFSVVEQPNGAYFPVYSDLGHTAVQFWRINSITKGPKKLAEMGVKDFDVISDIPYGPYACNAVADQRIEGESGMEVFHKRLSEALRETGASRITLALNKRATLDLHEVNRIRTDGLYDVVMYTP